MKIVKKILIVDPEFSIGDTLSRYLIGKGYSTILTSTSEEAMEILGRDGEIDLVISEITLGNEDGFKLLSEIKSKFPKVSVIMLTGMGFVEDLLAKAYEGGADGYISKIQPLEELLFAIKKPGG